MWRHQLLTVGIYGSLNKRQKMPSATASHTILHGTKFSLPHPIGGHLVVRHQARFALINIRDVQVSFGNQEDASATMIAHRLLSSVYTGDNDWPVYYLMLCLHDSRGVSLRRLRLRLSQSDSHSLCIQPI